jgi:hypothetical protein
MPLIVTGTIGIDTVHAPTGEAKEVLGGSASYFAAAASFLTPEKVRLVAAAGDDLPAGHHSALKSFPNLCLDGLEIRKGSKTFRWGGKYHENMNHRDTLFTELGVLEEAPPGVPGAYADSKYVFLANTHPAVQLGLIEQFPGRELAVCDTMDLWINTARDELIELLGKVDGVVLNDQEAAQLTEESNALTAGRKILEMGPTFAVIKKGEHGALLVHRDGVGALPAYPTETVVDPTGAGDSFAGGLMGHVAHIHATRGGNGGPPAAAFETVRHGLALGTVLASFTIESFSLDRLRTLTRAEIDDRCGAFRKIVNID